LKKATKEPTSVVAPDYGQLVTDISGLLEEARRSSVRVVNSIMTATYWRIGKRIVEFEQGGKERAEYGEYLIKRLSKDLTVQYGRGFSKRNLEQMRAFYLGWEIAQTPSAQLEVRVKLPTTADEHGNPILQTVSAKFSGYIIHNGLNG